MSETIAAIATPPAVGGISIIRISGPEAIAVASRVFRARSGEALAQKKGYTASYGDVCDETGAPLDESVATLFRAPKSYTGEDVVELSCHGGLAVTRDLLRAVLAQGASLAGPGEFTKRAFLNGKLSLTQAEAVGELIAARGRESLRAAKAQKDGALATRIQQILDGLLKLAGHLAAWADYPDEEIPELKPAQAAGVLRGAGQELAALLADFDRGMLVRQGIDTVIAGRPNVGKSTLMNLLSGAQRSIVADVAGTTRDVVEETVDLDGLLLRLSDTAGLRETSDRVESMGVERAVGKLEAARLVLAVFDASEPLNEDDRRLMARLADKPTVAVVNKSDLPQRLDGAELERRFDTVLYLSAEDAAALAPLAAAVRSKAGLAEFDSSAPQLATERQRDCARRAHGSVAEALSALESGMTMDAVTISAEDAIAALLELSGGRVSEAVVDEVFSHFCVGK